MPYNEQDVRELLELVVSKLNTSAARYKDAYILNDIDREIGEEIVDLVGWSIMEALRVRETLQKRVYGIENIYWEKFLSNQTDEFLSTLSKKVLKELQTRTNK